MDATPGEATLLQEYERFESDSEYEMCSNEEMSVLKVMGDVELMANVLPLGMPMSTDVQSSDLTSITPLKFTPYTFLKFAPNDSNIGERLYACWADEQKGVGFGA
ncbi:hypothetical protein N0V90_008304 [Kalmusia sp. IMI 367209]|nr:hypothetical protein N0V90_008304 [Kalmusia sp. IMI 367209]